MFNLQWANNAVEHRATAFNKTARDESHQEHGEG